MERILALFGLFLLFFAGNAHALQTIDSHIKVGQTTVHYGVYEAAEPRQADVLYFHGFGDRFQNHQKLFDEFNAAGFRVIGFDLPSHGGTTGTAIGGIDFHSFESLANIAQVVLASVRNSNDDRPLLFAGWSLGGLIATRILQIDSLREGFPKISALILYAPAFAPKKCVGDFLCRISNETLNHDASFVGREIKPDSPLRHVAFSARSLLASAFSWQPPLPGDLQTLVLLAGDGDAYVHSPRIVKWVGSHRSNYISRISGYKCRGARHEIDNEPASFGGEFVRKISIDFAKKVSAGERWEEEAGFSDQFQSPCDPF